MAEFPRLPLSGIKVIVVGAGFAGISAAIECDRKGHSVTLLEKVDDIAEITRYGDIISFGMPSAALLSMSTGRVLTSAQTLMAPKPSNAGPVRLRPWRK